MTTTAPYFLPHKIVDLPRAMFFHNYAVQHERSLGERFLIEMQKHKKVPPALLEVMSLIPSLVAEIYETSTPQEFPEEVFTALLEQPTVRFAILLEGWETFGGELETLLYPNPECVERLVNYLRETGLSGKLQLKDYLPFLRGEPNRWARVARMVAPDRREAELMNLREEALLRQADSAPHAYFVLAATKSTEVPAVSFDVLKADEEYAYMTSLLLRARKAAPEAWEPLLRDVTSCRWVYHILRDNLSSERAVFEERLATNPAWLVEYFNTGLVNHDVMGDLLTRATKVSGNNNLVNVMHHWFTTQSPLARPIRSIRDQTVPA